MELEWKETKFTNHGGTAWVMKDEAEARLQLSWKETQACRVGLLQSEADYNRVVCENQRLVLDWQAVEAEKEGLLLDLERVLDERETLGKYLLEANTDNILLAQTLDKWLQAASVELGR